MKNDKLKSCASNTSRVERLVILKRVNDSFNSLRNKCLRVDCVLRILCWNMAWMTLVISILLPLSVEAGFLEARHNRGDISNKRIGFSIFNDARRMPFRLFKLLEAVSQSTFENRRRAIVFNKRNGSQGEESADNATDKTRRESDYNIFQLLLQISQIAIGALIGGWIGTALVFNFNDWLHMRRKSPLQDPPKYND